MYCQHEKSKKPPREMTAEANREFYLNASRFFDEEASVCGKGSQIISWLFRLSSLSLRLSLPLHDGAQRHCGQGDKVEANPCRHV